MGFGIKFEFMLLPFLMKTSLFSLFVSFPHCMVATNSKPIGYYYLLLS